MYEGLIPPRAGTSISHKMLKAFDASWIAQAKKNGTNSVIVQEHGRLHAHNRHGETHKLWVFDDDSAEAFQKIKGLWVFNSELIHSKVKGIRNINYLHDVLVADGVEQWNVNYQDRYQKLVDLFCPVDKGDFAHYHVDDNTRIAKNFTQNFGQAYDKLDGPDDEGLMLKNVTAKLSPRDQTNASWLVRCRRTNKNLSF
jgi:ATP-dependent DNA ligase